ncbi:MAG: recombinase family protein [archaeon]|nr:recombinase family protein [archaeon]MDA0842343.1 recombinase family protein [archaeon]
MSVNGNKTIAYIRVSSQRQVDEGNSLEAQKRRIIQLAQFKGLSIAPEDFLIEKGVSAGIPLWERPMGRVLRRKLLSGGYSNLIAMKLDRLFRITTDMLLSVQEVQDMGVRLLIADLGGEAIDTSTSTGRFMLTIFGGIAEMERGLISERTQEGMDQLKAQNKRFTESIFGWDVNEDGMLEPNWYEQDLIDWMDWQIEDNGMSAAAVARSLNSRGITGKRGGKWQGQSVKRTISHAFHENRADFPYPSQWGSMPWHRD